MMFSEIQTYPFTQTYNPVFDVSPFTRNVSVIVMLYSCLCCRVCSYRCIFSLAAIDHWLPSVKIIDVYLTLQKPLNRGLNSWSLMNRSMGPCLLTKKTTGGGDFNLYQQ